MPWLLLILTPSYLHFFPKFYSLKLWRIVNHFISRFYFISKFSRVDFPKSFP